MKYYLKVYRLENKEIISNLMKNMHCFATVEIINDIITIFNDKIGKKELIRVFFFFFFSFFFINYFLFLVVIQYRFF
jgi:hypothetical protein